jgi:hypothetical protein
MLVAICLKTRLRIRAMRISSAARREFAMAGTPSRQVPVAPDSVRVWRGFRRTELTLDDFYAKLGSFFMPGTVQMQAPVGLTAYLPSVLPRNKDAAVPDEIAIVFYEYQDAYHEAKETVGGRAYSDLHGVAFDLRRSLSGFPVAFKGVLEPDERYHLFDEHVDWQIGVVNTFVGVPVRGKADLLDQFAGWLGDVQSRGDAGPDGAISAASREYLVYWEHWPNEVGAARSLIPSLNDLVKPVYQKTIEPYPIPQGLWDRFSGVECKGGESFNFQFERRKEMP